MNSGDTAWILMSTCLVQFMTPGLGFFYGGMVSEKAVVNTIMLSLGTMGIVSILWGVIGYSMAFGPSLPTGVVGDGTYAFLAIDDQVRINTTVPEYVYMIYQCMFAVITPAVISGGVVTKIKFLWFMAFAALWHLLVYCPLAHWVWNPEGWMFKWGVLDFAGGTVVETASGVTAFVLAFWLGKTPSLSHPLSSFIHPGESNLWGPTPPHNVPYVLLGAGLLWFGWFGFNAGSALAAGHLAGRALVNTHLAAAVGLGAWNVLEILLGSEEGYGKGKATSVGAASGLIVGLVAITPACGYVTAMWSMFIALFTTPIVYIGLKAIKASGVDDRLDVLGFHGISGMCGTALTGLFASKSAGAPADGAFYGGGGELFSKQLAAITVTIVLCTIGTTLIFWFLALIAGIFRTDLRVPREHQKDIDASQHGEKAYFTAIQSLQGIHHVPRPPTTTGGIVSSVVTVTDNNSNSLSTHSAAVSALTKNNTENNSSGSNQHTTVVTVNSGDIGSSSNTSNPGLPALPNGSG